MASGFTIPQIPTVRSYPLADDVAEVGNDVVTPSSAQSAQIDLNLFAHINLAVTGLTGGGTNLDNVPTVGRKLPSLMLIVISGALQAWILQTSSATPGAGVVEPLDNSALRWIQAL